jgi:hypothetical protein
MLCLRTRESVDQMMTDRLQSSAVSLRGTSARRSCVEKICDVRCLLFVDGVCMVHS